GPGGRHHRQPPGGRDVGRAGAGHQGPDPAQRARRHRPRLPNVLPRPPGPLRGAGRVGGVLWRRPDFLKFWFGQTVSLFGNQFTYLALPLAAVLTLHANAAQMGLLGAFEFLPALLFGLPAGIWLDRTRRRPVMVAAQLLNVAALATIPGAAVLHVFSLPQLYAVAFVTGSANSFYSIAQTAFVPTLAGRENLVEANAKYQTSMTVASLAGPGLAGFTVQV